MKLLVIGIDGGDRRVMEGLGLPFFSELTKKGRFFDLTEDLCSRGWTEVLTGLDGPASGAFYEKPKLNGTHEFTQKFGKSDLEKNAAANPLWDFFYEKGMRAGFMNVPTMNPPPKTNGFVVAGGGAGSGSGTGKPGIPESCCNPPELAAQLNAHGYILDTRLQKSGIKDIYEFLAVLGDMEARRCRSFAQLTAKAPLDFGLVVVAGTTRVQYLAMSEIEALLAQVQMPEIARSATSRPRSSLHQALLELYTTVDESLRQLVETVAPEEIIVTSDHGTAPYLHALNANFALRRLDFQCVGAWSAIERLLFAIEPARSKSFLARAIRKVNRSLPTVDWRRTRAFGARYVSGIFVNDERRFGGPVKEADVPLVVSEILEALPSLPEMKQHGISARPYRSEHKGAYAEDALPDIWLDYPDTIFADWVGGFVMPNRRYGEVTSLKGIYSDIVTGIKGRHPLFWASDGVAKFAEADTGPANLTKVYRTIISYFDAQG